MIFLSQDLGSDLHIKQRALSALDFFGNEDHGVDDQQNSKQKIEQKQKSKRKIVKGLLNYPTLSQTVYKCFFTVGVTLDAGILKHWI